jgi:hypothetical protein
MKRTREWQRDCVLWDWIALLLYRHVTIHSTCTGKSTTRNVRAEDSRRPSKTKH